MLQAILNIDLTVKYNNRLHFENWSLAVHCQQAEAVIPECCKTAAINN